MPQYQVDIERSDVVQETFGVEAATPEEADIAAHTHAGDMVWRRSSDPTYTTLQVREVLPSGMTKPANAGMGLTLAQLTWIVEQTLVAGLDRIEAREDAPDKSEVVGDINGCRETTGMALAILYAQITGDSMEIEGCYNVIGDQSYEVFSDAKWAGQVLRDERDRVHKWASDYATCIVNDTPK